MQNTIENKTLALNKTTLKLATPTPTPKDPPKITIKTGINDNIMRRPIENRSIFFDNDVILDLFNQFNEAKTKPCQFNKIFYTIIKEADKVLAKRLKMKDKSLKRRQLAKLKYLQKNPIINNNKTKKNDK